MCVFAGFCTRLQTKNRFGERDSCLLLMVLVGYANSSDCHLPSITMTSGRAACTRQPRSIALDTSHILSPQVIHQPTVNSAPSLYAQNSSGLHLLANVSSWYRLTGGLISSTGRGGVWRFFEELVDARSSRAPSWLALGSTGGLVTDEMSTATSRDDIGGTALCSICSLSLRCHHTTGALINIQSIDAGFDGAVTHLQ